MPTKKKNDKYEELLTQVRTLDLETLRRLNRDVCEAMKDRRRMDAHGLALKFKVGDRVGAVGRGGRVLEGLIEKVNVTRVKLRNEADKRIWNVPLDMLEHVEGGKA